MLKRYKVMAYMLSSGLWDAGGRVALTQILGKRDAVLERDLQHWQDAYDDQFKSYPYDFDWDEFNRQGQELTARIGAKLLPGYSIYYESSDDREFFRNDDCAVTRVQSGLSREQLLRERNREVQSESISPLT